MQTPQTRYAKSDDVNIAYQVFGQGEHTIVMAPAWVTHVDLAWEEPAQARFLQNLSRFARVILFDKRGTGASDRHVGCPCLENRMDDIRAVMDATGTERAAIFGCCDGGTMASLFAATHPDRATHLILFGLFAKRLRSEDYPWAPTPEERERYFALLERSWGQGIDAAAMAPSRRGDQAFLEWCGRLERIAASPGAAIELAKLNTEIDIRPVLPAIKAPTLVVRRRDDAEIHPDETRYIARAIPNAKYIELDGADHLPWAGGGDDLISEVQEFVTGVRPAHADSALVTIVCTDLVDSTQRAAQLGDRRWGDVIQRHDAIVGAEIRRFQGKQINTTGDGVLAAFDSPARGVRAALSIKEALRTALDLPIRAGVHTGECEIRQGVPTGIAVNIGARVAAIAAAGEVLASRVVRDLAVGSGIEFADRGEHALKGVPGEWRVYAALSG